MNESDESATEQSPFERHRALVRETDRRFATVYGVGGAAILGAGATVLVVGWLLGALASALPWVLAVTLALIAVFVVRTVVNKRREVLARQVLTYCELNDLDREELCAYYESEGIYPYFLSLFTAPASRAQ